MTKTADFDKMYDDFREIVNKKIAENTERGKRDVKTYRQKDSEATKDQDQDEEKTPITDEKDLDAKVEQEMPDLEDQAIDDPEEKRALEDESLQVPDHPLIKATDLQIV